MFLDQCRFGLVHPEDSRPLKKYTRLQTTSNAMVRNLDGRFCQGNHSHAQIAGSCHFHGNRMALSRFAAFYPRVFARAAAKSVLQETYQSSLPLLREADVLDAYPAETDESPAKRARVSSPRESKRKAEPVEQERTLLSGSQWEGVFDWLQSNLPKSGSVSLPVTEWPENQPMPFVGPYANAEEQNNYMTWERNSGPNKLLEEWLSQVIS